MCGAGVAVDYGALDGLEGIRLQLGDGFQVGEVVDVGGDVKEQVAGRLDLQVAEECGALGADTADVLDRSQQPIGGDVGGELIEGGYLGCVWHKGLNRELP